jgi:large subunit ribosomal protein L24
VVVIAGKDRGKQGEVLRTLPGARKIVVRGVNVLKRHVKAGQSAGGTKAVQGGVVDFEAPLSYSNVMLVCPHCNQPTRVKHTVLENGAKALECRQCGEPYERIRRTEVQ